MRSYIFLAPALMGLTGCVVHPHQFGGPFDKMPAHLLLHAGAPIAAPIPGLSVFKALDGNNAVVENVSCYMPRLFRVASSATAPMSFYRTGLFNEEYEFVTDGRLTPADFDAVLAALGGKTVLVPCSAELYGLTVPGIDGTKVELSSAISASGDLILHVRLRAGRGHKKAVDHLLASPTGIVVVAAIRSGASTFQVPILLQK